MTWPTRWLRLARNATPCVLSHGFGTDVTPAKHMGMVKTTATLGMLLYTGSGATRMVTSQRTSCHCSHLAWVFLQPKLTRINENISN